MRNNKFFLGIDPGLKYTGVAVIDKNKKIVFSENIEIQDIENIGKRIEKILKKFKPELSAIESAFTKRNPRDAIKLGEVRGVIIYILKKKKIKYIDVPASRWKRGVIGTGKAKNYQIKYILKKFLNSELSNGISYHEIDAIALAYYAMTKCSTK